MIRRHLPHLYPHNRWLFLTWRLHGSLPHSQFPPARKVLNGQAFACVDWYLDGADSGPVYLCQQSIATIVVRSLFRGQELGHYELGPWVIMPNHVHALFMPWIAPNLLLKSLKGATAREANRILARTGDQFWQRESYDHYIRNEQEWYRIARYIERNPVKAGLAGRVEDYPWSSANPKYQPSVHTSVNAARKSACATDTKILA